MPRGSRPIWQSQRPFMIVHFVYNGHMQYISATEAKQRLAALLDHAQREPVTIQRQNRDVAVVLSPQEYERLRGFVIAEFERLCDQIGGRAEAGGLTEAELTSILADE